MVDNDTFTYHLKKSLNRPVDSAVHSLITQERTQKLELLIHLLANLTQPLVVCGPEGIGKTTLLKVLQDRKVESWLYCPIQGNAGLSFEKIQENLSKTIAHDRSESYSQALKAAFGQNECQNKNIILIVDDAGRLVPGLITTIIRYVESNPVLRVVFVLTHDELHVKNRSDRIIDDCHFVEIPPLSEKQCGEFLQHLSTKSWTQISFNAINENMVETVYRETHGIPGKIIAELPVLASNPKPSVNNRWILTAAVAGLVIIALYVQWMSSVRHTEDNAVATSSVGSRQSGNEKTPSLTALLPPAPTEITQNEHSVPPIQQETLQQRPLMNEKISTLSEAEGILDNLDELETLAAAPENKPGENDADSPSLDLEKKRLLNDMQPLENKLHLDKNGKFDEAKIDKPVDHVEPVFAEESGISDEKKNLEATTTVSNEQAVDVSVAQDSGRQWLATQPANNYTLQLMVLSKQQSVMNVLKKYPALGKEIRYVRKITKGKERYVLMYGSFSSSTQASLARISLPAEFRRAIPVKISTIK
jgi:DamX protein